MESRSGQTPERPTPPERPQPPSPGGQPPPGGPPPPSTPPPSTQPPQKPGKKLSERLREPKVAAGVGIGLAVLIILLLVLTGGGDDGSESESSDTPTREPREVSAQELEDVAASVDHPVYWVGEQEGKKLELTESPEGNIFVRYLDPDVEIGSREVGALTIGTYPVPDAFGVVQETAKQKGALRGETPDGGIVVSNQSAPNSVYLAYPGTDVQIEVYDPNPQVAFETATSGDVEPVQ
jgi:hypothetical protein